MRGRVQSRWLASSASAADTSSAPSASAAHLMRLRLRLHARRQIVEDLAFDGERAVRRRGDARLQLRQLRRREAHRVGHRLPMNEMLR